MRSMRRSAQVYLVATVIAAVALLGILSLDPEQGSPGVVLIALLFTGLAGLVYYAPISFAFKRRLYLDTAVAVGAILLFEPGLAMAVIGIGALAGQIARRSPYEENAFNSAIAMLQTGIGALLYSALGYSAGALALSDPWFYPALLLVVVAMYALNALFLAIIIGLQSGAPPLKVLRESVKPFELMGQCAQLGLGLTAALLATSGPWLLPLLIIPGVALYRLLISYVQGQKHMILGRLESFADLVDARDPFATGHSRRVAVFARQLASQMNLPREEIDVIEQAAALHELGKLTIDTSSIVKTGTLTDEDRILLRRLPGQAAQLLEQFPETALAAPLVHHHNERVDGRGYPAGLSGEAIPLGARIISAANALDAMLSHRPHRPPLSPAEIRHEFARNRGIQWDAKVVDALFELINREKISLKPVDPARDVVLTEGISAAPRSIDQQLQHQAFHDPLTDLPNRTFLLNRLTQLLNQASQEFAVLFIDLDNFKDINDEAGHRAGDEVLIEISRRLRAELRSGDLVARYGGDEFIVVLQDVERLDVATDVAATLLAALKRPFAYEGRSYTTGASIGVALGSPGSSEPEELLQHADAAMYQAKKNGKAGIGLHPSGVVDLRRHDQLLAS